MKNQQNSCTTTGHIPQTSHYKDVNIPAWLPAGQFLKINHSHKVTALSSTASHLKTPLKAHRVKLHKDSGGVEVNGSDPLDRVDLHRAVS